MQNYPEFKETIIPIKGGDMYYSSISKKKKKQHQKFIKALYIKKKLLS